MGDFVKAVKAHAKLRCTVSDSQSLTGLKLDEAMYAKMTYWVCAYAKKLALHSGCPRQSHLELRWR